MRRSARLAFEVPDSAKNLCAVMKLCAASKSEIASVKRTQKTQRAGAQFAQQLRASLDSAMISVLASLSTALRFRLPRAVLFDADGTLLNSLPAHVEFCRTLNDERALGLALPASSDLAASRKITGAPMAQFFLNAGFPDDVVPACVAEYEARFAAECPVVPYDGVDTLLRRVRDEIGAAAIVTSNTAVNVRRGLGPNLGADLEIFGIDNGPTTKREAIALALDRLGVAAPDDATYVGDTRSDFAAATACGLRFVGVDYGFEALRGAVDAPVAADVDELCALLCGPDR